MMVRILRPTRPTPIVSAGVFEDLFVRHLGRLFDICKKPLEQWCRGVLGPPDHPLSIEEASGRFMEETGEYDFFCPAFECIPLSPIFMALRNLGGSDIRLLLIAHAPGAYAMEWALLQPLLAAGDLIVAPSNSGKATIEYLCPELSPFIRVIHHPIHLLTPEPVDPPSPSQRGIVRVVSMGRIEETKLIHRQIEAVDCLRQRGFKKVRMQIAGPLKDYGTGQLTAYARSLQLKIRRLHLDEQVELLGVLEGETVRAAFLSGARMMLCLSRTVEEAFPKAAVEALGLGIPVVGTCWDGLLETVGPAGILVPFKETRNGKIDVEAAAIAGAMAQLLENPISPAACIKQAEKFLPHHAQAQYSKILAEALGYYPSMEAPVGGNGEAGPFSSAGLLGGFACLKPFSSQELFRFHWEYAHMIREKWEGRSVDKTCHGERLYGLVFLSARRPLEYFLAHLNGQGRFKSHGAAAAVNPPGSENGDDFFARIAWGMKMPDSCRNSREVALAVLYSEGRWDLLEAGLQYMEATGLKSKGLDFLNIYLLLHKGEVTGAYKEFRSKHSMDIITEAEAPLVGQVARICRDMGRPGEALPWLRTWLEKYPDSPDSGEVWLDRAMNAFYCGSGLLSEAAAALERSRELLGETPEVTSMGYSIYLRASGQGPLPDAAEG